MAKPATRKEEQREVRHIFSKGRTQANKGADRKDIERRAYEIYVARGGSDGNAVEDWLQAERELQERQPEMGSSS